MINKFKWAVVAIYTVGWGYLLWSGYHDFSWLALSATGVFILFGLDEPKQTAWWIMSAAYLWMAWYKW